MAKKKPAKPAPPKKPADPAAVAARRKLFLKIGLNALGLIAVGGGLAVAVVQSKAYLDATADTPTVVLTDRPAWMSDAVAGQILAAARPAGPTAPSDAGLLRDHADRLAAVPWVRQVNQVRRVYRDAPGDTLAVSCDYRAPAALVAWRDRDWLVDREGVMLPEGFSAAQSPKVVYGADGRINLRRVIGAASAPAGAGAAWPGQDVRAGLDLLALVEKYAFAADVEGVDVSNYGGRRDPAAAQLVLFTRHDGTEIRWGRPVDKADQLAEVPTAVKLRTLEAIYEKHGRADAGYRWIDVRLDTVSGSPAGGP